MDIDSVAFAYSDGFVSTFHALRHSLTVAAGMYVSGRSTIGYGCHTGAVVGGRRRHRGACFVAKLLAGPRLRVKFTVAPTWPPSPSNSTFSPLSLSLSPLLSPKSRPHTILSLSLSLSTPTYQRSVHNAVLLGLSVACLFSLARVSAIRDVRVEI
jgi:hypothetical protein